MKSLAKFDFVRRGPFAAIQNDEKSAGGEEIGFLSFWNLKIDQTV